MKLLHDLDDFPHTMRGGALAIGNFDGVHRGHAVLLARLKHWANAVEGPAIVFTFDPHPVRLLRPNDAPPPLTWINRKADLLARLGMDAVVAFPTSLDLLELSYVDFFRQIVVEKIAARALVEGPNFFFGKGREGNVNNLPELCAAHGLEFEVVQPQKVDEEMISSSRIRNLVAEGDVQRASEFLTQPYRIRGMVTHGARRGRTIGFPTANLDAIDTLVPAHGVFAGRAYFRQTQYMAAIHIGPNPTFGEQRTKVEVHILDFDQMVYGEVLEVDFLHKLRGIRQFEDHAELVAQLRADVQQARVVASAASTID